MCGITGAYVPRLVGRGEELRQQVGGMCAALAHRGPDEAGFFVAEHVGLALGHQRLSIIDVASGQQPLANHDRTLWLVFNGEIYNYRELREELIGKGHVFRTRSDTETIIYAYQEWGEACVHKLRGMFAFAIWDQRKRQLFCARDRLGVKPFYYFWDGESFIFASELKSVITHPLAQAALNKPLNRDALINYLRLQYIPAPLTPFQNVNKLPAGFTLTLGAGKLTSRRYWALEANAQLAHSDYDEAAHLLRSKLEESVRIRLVSEVPIGAFLSGGTDSSVVVALMAQGAPGRIKTHCVGFDDAAFDERQHARYIADRFGADHHESIARLDIAGDLEKIIWHLDEPLADASAVPTYYLCRETRSRVTVSLSGDGGDEMFAGYNWYAELQQLQQLDRKIPGLVRAAVSGVLGNTIPEHWRGSTLLRNIGADVARRHSNLRTCFTDKQIERLLRSSVGPHASLPEHPVAALYHGIENAEDDPVRAAQWVDVQTYMVEDILMKVDKMSMAHSLEVRVPLLDYQIAEFAFSLPTEWKIQNAARKRILKSCVSDLIPPEFFERKKHGFSVPLRRWLLGDLRGHVEELLLRPGAPASGVFEPSEVTKLWHQFERGRASIDLSHHLWSILCFEIWYRQYKSVGRA